MTRNKTIKLTTSGMTCTACERRIENSLSKQEGIIDCRAKYSQSTVEVTYDEDVTGLDTIRKTLDELHYPVAESMSVNRDKMRQWISSGLILLLIVIGYILLDQSGGFNFFPIADENTAFPTLFVIGLLTSIHCIAMCGGLNISQCASYKMTNSLSRYQKISPGLFYNGGRVISYTITGGIVGTIGSVVMLSGSSKGIVVIAASLFMMMMGLNMLGLFPFLRMFVPGIPKYVVKRTDRKKAGKGPFVLGLLNGFMPCGPLQAMQLYALSTGSFIMGALSMFLFSLGTVPLMLSLSVLSSFLSARFTGVMMKTSAVLVMLLGLMMLNNGLSLSGLNPIF